MDPCQSPNEQDEVWVLEDNKNREEFVQHLSGPLLFIFDSKLRSTATMTWEGRGDQGLRPPRDEGLGHPARSAAYTSKSDEHERTWREMMVPVAALRPTAATEAVVYVTNLSLVSFPRKKEP